MIKVICSGKLKEKYLIELVNDYLNRIKKYHKIELIEIKDENNIEKEKENILKHIGSNEYLITLDINGECVDSRKFAEIIDKAFISYSTITFIIGSSDGLSDEIKNIANKNISFSSLTFPHGLFRGMLMEQIYRSFKINNNESYHK